MSEPFITLSLKWIAEKTLDLVVEQIEKRVLDDIDPRLGQIQEELTELRNTQDEIRIAPLREGLRHLSLGELDKAVDKLIEAEANNPLAPIPKLLLAEALLEKAEPQASALLPWSEAAELNPYCVLDRVNGPQSPGLSAIPPIIPGESEAFKPWTLSLSEDQFRNDLARRCKWPRLRLGEYAWIQASPCLAIAAASVCGESLAVEWLQSQNLRHGSEKVLAIFRLDSREPVWAHLNKKEDLLFVTYRHVVVYRRERETYELLDLKDGRSLKRMTKGYFLTMFAGSSSEPRVFARSNWRGTPPEEAYKKSALFSGPPVAKFDPTFEHTPKLFREIGHLHDPWGFRTPVVKILNRWNHYHFPGGANTLSSCRLDGTAQIICGDPHRTEAVENG